ncbi:recombination regulator RecX [Thermobifida halotolerans]|uniref:Regulatory protein RecX n=1 Tax=Thermobifida halotolerans TaxID=483545 RepID=A0A399G3R8_9ACTN|nr:recombination regulator RecX [Thermobifida halotolerans]UOE19897.1 recombination regulator RecX [Thermobifida halotolerans]
MPDGHGRHAAEQTGPPEGGDARPEDPEARARAICLRLLTHAPRTRAQLAEALRRRGIPDETAEAVLGRFGEVGIVDDAAFAGAWVDSRHAGRGLARRALAVELRQRGVHEDTVREAVAELTPEQEEATARRLVRRRLAATRGRSTEVRVRRLMGMLARKGYPAGLAYRLVREELEAEGVEVEFDVPDDV